MTTELEEQQRLVLNQEDYVKKLQKIVKKNYFPDLYNYQRQIEKKSKSNNVEQSNENNFDQMKGDEVGLDQFMAKFVSQDNIAYNQLQNNSKEEFRKKYFWQFQEWKNVLAIQSENPQQNNNKFLPDYKKFNQNVFHFIPKQLMIKSANVDDDDIDQVIEPKIIKRQNTRLPKQYLFKFEKQNQKKDVKLNLLSKELPNQLKSQIKQQNKEKHKLKKEKHKLKKEKHKLKKENGWKAIQIEKITLSKKNNRDGLGIYKVSERQRVGLKLQADIQRKRQQKRSQNKLKQAQGTTPRKSVISQTGKQLLKSLKSNRNLNLKTPNIFKKY